MLNLAGRSLAAALSAVLALAGSGCRAAADVAGVSRDIIVINHVNVLDGRGGETQGNMQVVVRAGTIVRLAPADRPVPTGAKVIDARGRYLVPGFIDMHAHLLFPRCGAGDDEPRFDRALSERVLSRLLDFGITTVRSPATPTVEGLHLRDDLDAGVVRGPRATAAAELINDPSLTAEALRRYVRDALPYRPDYFKVYARLRPEQVATVVDEAHRYKIPVIGHLQRTSWAEGLALGVDHLAHAVDWSIESLPVAKRPIYEEALKRRPGFRSRLDWLELFDMDTAGQRRLLADIARKRVSVDVTLVAYDGKFSPESEGRYRRNPFLASFPELRQDWQGCSDATADWTTDDFRRWRFARRKLLAWVKRMHDAGVLLVTGTDLTNEWVIPGEALHQEFELLAEAGLRPREILRMTGADAAEALRSPQVGVIEAGRRADLVLLSADPSKDIRNTRRIAWVMQGGRIVARQLLRPTS